MVTSDCLGDGGDAGKILSLVEILEIIQRDAGTVLVNAKAAVREDGISLDSVASGQVIAHPNRAIEGDDVAFAAIGSPNGVVVGEEYVDAVSCITERSDTIGCRADKIALNSGRIR